MASAGEGLRKNVGVAVGGAVGFSERFGSSAAGGNQQESGTERRRVNDGVVLVPGPTLGIRSFDDPYRRAPGHLRLLDESTREERYPLPVGRKERLPGAVGTGHRAGLKRIEIAQVELRFAGALLGGVGDGAAVARDGGIADDFLPRRKRDGQAGLSFRVFPELGRAIRRNPQPQRHRSQLQSPMYLVCRLLLEKKRRL